MIRCAVCRCEVDVPCVDLVTCPVLDNLLGPVFPPKRKVANQCAVDGCTRTKAKYSAYCKAHRAEMHNKSNYEKLSNKRAGTR